MAQTRQEIVKLDNTINSNYDIQTANFLNGNYSLPNNQINQLLQHSPSINQAEQVNTMKMSNRVYISNIPNKISKTQLSGLLQPYGPLISLNIIYRGDFAFAFAEFDDMRDAVVAVRQLNQTVYQRRRLRVEFKNIKSNQIKDNKDINNAPKNIEADLNDNYKTKNNNKENIITSTETSLSYKNPQKITKNTQNIKNKHNSAKNRKNSDLSKDDRSSQHLSRQRSRDKNRRYQQKRDQSYDSFNSRSPTYISRNPRHQHRKSLDNRYEYQSEHLFSLQNQFHEIQDEILHLQKSLHRIHDKLYSAFNIRKRILRTQRNNSKHNSNKY